MQINGGGADCQKGCMYTGISDDLVQSWSIQREGRGNNPELEMRHERGPDLQV